MKLSVVIPAYNEEKRIGRTLETVCEYLNKQVYDWEVLAVNNNSKDGTARVINEHAASCPEIRLIDEPRQGKGYAVQGGMLAATGTVRLFMDADNATTVDQVANLLPFLNQGYDVVIGSLGVPGAVVVHGGEEPFWRVLLGKAGNLWIQALAVWGIHDTQRGFKLFTARATQDIFPRMTIFGWGFDIEVLAVARTHGYRIKEVPVVWKNDPDSRVNFWAYPKTLWDTVKVFKNRIFRRYR